MAANFKFKITSSTEVPVIFHIINNKGLNFTVEDQMEVLNQAFENSVFSFKLLGINYVENDSWDNLYKPREGESDEALDMKKKLHVEVKHVLNVYVTSILGGVLGYANFPNSDENDYRHGVVIDSGTMPNGGIKDYEEGYTLVHEWVII